MLKATKDNGQKTGKLFVKIEVIKSAKDDPLDNNLSNKQAESFANFFNGKIIDLENEN